MSFRNKIPVILLCIMSAICVIALCIAIKVTVVAVERQEQEVYQSPIEEEKSVQALSKTVNVNKLTEQKLLLNGINIDGISAFLADKRDFLLPLDSILSYLGIEYRLYSSDDLVVAEIAGKKLTVKIDKDTFVYGEKESKLQVAPVIARDHILVPAEMFSDIEGFNTSISAWENTVFLNCYKDFQELQALKIKMLRLNNGSGGIWDITGRRELWDREDVRKGLESFEPSPDGSKYIFKSDNDTFMINPDISSIPYKIQAGDIRGWDKDGRYVYWEDTESDKIFLYDSEKGIKSQVDRYMRRAESQDGLSGLSNGVYSLIKFAEFGSYKRISMENLLLGRIYTMIQKNANIIAEGNIKISPDEKKMVYKKSDGLYCISNIDGTAGVEIGEGLEADWISNNRISVDRGYEVVLFDGRGKWKSSSKNYWKRLGQAGDGSLFYTDGETLYAEKDGNERKLMDLPWEGSYAFASSIGGPYIIGSEKEDGVYYVNSGNITYIGKYSLMQRSYEGYRFGYDFERSVTISPEKDYFMLMQREKNITTLNFINTADNTIKDIVLDCKIRDNIKIKWMPEGKVLLYTANKLWLIDFKNDVQIYNYREMHGASIEGVL